MVDIFISYAREDKDAVRRLAAAFEAQGWSVFWDLTIPAGENWHAHTGKALTDARCVVVAWSVASIKSSWVLEEAEEAKSRNVLIPVLLAPVSPPFGFRLIQAANLVGWGGDADDELFVQFRAAIARKLGDPPALIEEQERQRAEAERKAAELAQKQRLEDERKAAEFEERRRAEAERKEAELKEKQHAEAQRRAREQEAKQRREADANEEVRGPSTQIPETVKPNPLGKRIAIALIVVVSIIAVVAWNKMPTVTTKIPPATYALTVITTPPGASIKIENVGQYAPGMRLEAGTYRVSATLAGYQAAERTFEVSERDVTLDFALQPVTYGLDMTTTPPGASVEIENVGPYAPGMRLKAGTYRVRATLAGHQAAERTFEVAGGDVALEIALQPTLPLPELVRIPAGTFMMGSEDGDPNERPVRVVHIGQPFYLGATEVTFDQYVAFAAATGRILPDDQDWGQSDLPVTKVTWNDATTYAQWLGKATGNSCRLPSEAEWEYAARAGTQTRFALPAAEGGDNLSGYANCNDCGSSEHVAAALNEQIGERALPVASFPANAWGLHDMHGNVWEWVEDCWHGSYEGAPIDGSNWLGVNGGKCSKRVLRGGSWDVNLDFARSANRNRFNPNVRFDLIGFRVLCSSPILDTDH